MSDNKHYYYIKLKADYFDSDEMIVLESMPDGYKYSNILLKFILRSIKNDGKLMFNKTIPFNSNMLANVTRHSVGDIEKAVDIFQKLNLIEILQNGAIYINDIQNYIGKSSTEADRKRAYRLRINEDKKLLGQMSEECPDKNPPELELEIKLEKEKELKLKATEQNDMKSFLSFKSFCVEKYKGQVLTNCCPTLLVGNELRINDNGYLESYYNGNKIDINPNRAKELWKILYENQDVIGVILGSGTRFMAFSIFLMMSGAMIMGGHINNGFFMNWYGAQPGEGIEYFILVIGLALSLIIGGSGKFSVDNLISRKLK